MSNIGKTIYGCCNGFFGSGVCADERRIEAEGWDWIVARSISNIDAYPEFASFTDEKQKNEYVEDWSKPVFNE